MDLDTGEAGFTYGRCGVGETLDDVEDVGFRHGARPSRREARKIDADERHLRRGERLGIDVARRVPTAMPDLRPQVIAGLRAGAGVSLERLEASVAVVGEIARWFEAPAVDLDVAGKQQARAATRPAAVEPDMGLGRAVFVVGEALYQLPLTLTQGFP